MRKTRPCSVCGKMTGGLLFNDKSLDVAICSRKCQYEYLEASSSKDETGVLRYLDDRIERTRSYRKIGWLIAGFGLLIVAAGFFMSQATVFIFGAFPLTIGALSTSLFEDEIDKLTRLRKRVAI